MLRSTQMDLHRLAEERSLAFHRVVASRLLQDPTILETARVRVKEWAASMPERPFVQAWAKILGGDPRSVASFMVERSERATELRQSSPFAGVLTPRERWQIWEETRQRLERQA